MTRILKTVLWAIMLPSCPGCDVVDEVESIGSFGGSVSYRCDLEVRQNEEVVAALDGVHICVDPSEPIPHSAWTVNEWSAAWSSCSAVADQLSLGPVGTWSCDGACHASTEVCL